MNTIESKANIAADMPQPKAKRAAAKKAKLAKKAARPSRP